MKWIRYIGPNSTSLETPKEDPVLTSYAKLLSEGLDIQLTGYTQFLCTCRYACSWSRFSPSTDGVSGEGKDLWVFYFTSLPDLSGQLAPGLQGDLIHGKCICPISPILLLLVQYVVRTVPIEEEWELPLHMYTYYVHMACTVMME